MCRWLRDCDVLRPTGNGLTIAHCLSAMILKRGRGYDVMVACQLPKLIARVRFPLPAPPYRICSLSGLIEPANPVLERCRSAHITLDDLRNRLFIPGQEPRLFPVRSSLRCRAWLQPFLEGRGSGDPYLRGHASFLAAATDDVSPSGVQGCSLVLVRTTVEWRGILASRSRRSARAG